MELGPQYSDTKDNSNIKKIKYWYPVNTTLLDNLVNNAVPLSA